MPDGMALELGTLISLKKFPYRPFCHSVTGCIARLFIGAKRVVPSVTFLCLLLFPINHAVASAESPARRTEAAKILDTYRMTSSMDTAQHPSGTGFDQSCPSCGADITTLLQKLAERTQSRVSELETQVRILTDKATAAGGSRCFFFFSAVH